MLRFDFFGLGDSEGDLDETMLADVYNNIEVGRYVDDTLAALNWLSAEHGARRFVLGGLCGGAITAILAAERDARVDSLLSIGMTVTLASNAAKPGQYLTRAQLDDRRRRYLLKMLQARGMVAFFHVPQRIRRDLEGDEAGVRQGRAEAGGAGRRTSRPISVAMPIRCSPRPTSRSSRAADAPSCSSASAIGCNPNTKRNSRSPTPRSSRRMPHRSSST